MQISPSNHPPTSQKLKMPNCVTQLKLDTVEKLSSTIFCCLSVSQSVRHRCHPTKSPLFPIYTGIQALCWPNTIYKGIKVLFWVTHSILGLVLLTNLLDLNCISLHDKDETTNTEKMRQQILIITTMYFKNATGSHKVLHFHVFF